MVERRAQDGGGGQSAGGKWRLEDGGIRRESERRGRKLKVVGSGDECKEWG